jgi:glycosyltransferase involved in cell wall biosynthesis
MLVNSLVSIIIPTFNRAYLIGETLDSILAQTYENWECIIVDDGSTDNTNEIVAGYLKNDSRFQYHHRPKNRRKGANTCRNYGLEISTGEFVNWFDSDDIMLKDKLQTQYDALKNSEFNFSVCQTLVFEGDVSNILGLRHGKIKSETPLLDYIKHEITFLTPSPLFKMKFLKDKNLKFNEDLHAAQEWEFICRLLYFSPDYHMENESLILIRKHNNSITYSNNLDNRQWNYYLAREKVFYFLKCKGDFHSKSQIFVFLKDYFEDYFRTILFTKQHRKIMQVFLKTIVPFNTVYQNLKFFYIVSIVLLTGKGYRYRKAI